MLYAKILLSYQKQVFSVKSWYGIEYTSLCWAYVVLFRFKELYVCFTHKPLKDVKNNLSYFTPPHLLLQKSADNVRN